MFKYILVIQMTQNSASVQWFKIFSPKLPEILLQVTCTVLSPFLQRAQQSIVTFKTNCSTTSPQHTN